MQRKGVVAIGGRFVAEKCRRFTGGGIRRERKFPTRWRVRFECFLKLGSYRMVQALPNTPSWGHGSSSVALSEPSVISCAKTVRSTASAMKPCAPGLTPLEIVSAMLPERVPQPRATLRLRSSRLSSVPTKQSFVTSEMVDVSCDKIKTSGLFRAGLRMVNTHRRHLLSRTIPHPSCASPDISAALQTSRCFLTASSVSCSTLPRRRPLAHSLTECSIPLRHASRVAIAHCRALCAIT
jgi:hypothetical protein